MEACNIEITNHARERMKNRFFMPNNNEYIKSLILKGERLNKNEKKIYCLAFGMKILDMNRFQNVIKNAGMCFIMKKEYNKHILVTVIPWNWVIENASEKL